MNPNMNLSNLSILVTGGAGFIGSHVVEFLLTMGAKFVRILDNLSTGSMENINALLEKYQNVEFIFGDITNLETCYNACYGIDIICHQAAIGSVQKSVEDPITSHNVNVNGFFNILVAARKENIKRIVYASSSSVYGSDDSPDKCEEKIGVQLSPYAVTKYIDELYAKIFTDIYGLECIGLRYFNVFGPKQDPNGAHAAVIPKFIDVIINDQSPTIYGDGNYTRDFTYIDNVVEANYLAMTTSNIQCFGEVFNVGTNCNISINELVTTIKNILDKKSLDAIYGPYRMGDIAHSKACIEKITRYLGYRPKVDFTEGLKITIQYFLSRNCQPKH